ncbi:aspartate aminotransferase [Chromatiales bacterium (ex Bugula neritina AB1)]|nr:aspartate aminotransferase [Chromatiales bacterium (ex Bugula neritina AB1)]
MKISSLTDRISGEGAAAWEIHGQAQQALAKGEDVIVLSVGDPDFPTPAPIIDRAKQALSDGDTHYAMVPGRVALREAIAADFQKQSGVACDIDNVYVFAGTQNALFSTSLILLDQGDEVIALEPMYVSYEASLGIGGAKLIPVAQPAENNFRPDAALIKQAITAKTRAIVITTPNNPTGVVMTYDELQQIANLAIENDLWVISDEVYTDVIFEGEHLSIASLPGMAERTITINSLSKSHAMTGWRIGWAIGPKMLAPHFDNLALCMLYGLPGFIQEAAVTALTDQRSASLSMRDIYRRRRDLVSRELKKAQHLKVLIPQAAMYVMVDVRNYGMGSDEFCRALYMATGVSVLDAGAFGKSADGWVRISFTLGDEVLVEGCRRIVKFLNER